MKLAEVTKNGRTVQMHYSETLGYSVHAWDAQTQGSTLFIPTREQAEKAFLWDVGYVQWRKDSEAAFKSSKTAWLTKYPTLKSVEAKVFSP